MKADQVPTDPFRSLVKVIVSGDIATVIRLLNASPHLATERTVDGATRQTAKDNFFDRIQHYIYERDAALHVAAEAKQGRIVRELIARGGNVKAGVVLSRFIMQSMVGRDHLLVDAKPPLRPKHVWSIRTKLQVESRTRDLALFKIAIDSELRGCVVVALKVDDVAPSGYAADRASVRQKKAGRPVKFEPTEATRQTIDDYLRATGKKPGDRLFTGRRRPDRSLMTRQYARLLSEWLIGSSPLRNAFTASNQGDAHLWTHRQLAGRAASARGI